MHFRSFSAFHALAKHERQVLDTCQPNPAPEFDRCQSAYAQNVFSRAEDRAR